MPSISYSHKMAIEATLRLVERDLRRIQETLERGNREKEAIMYLTKWDIRDSARPKILEAIAAMLEEIARMKVEFELEATQDTAGSHIRGSLAEIWVAIEELRPEALKGFGRLSEPSRKEIAANVLRLLRSYDELSDALHDSRTREDSVESR